ncbi:collagen alpha-1(XXII) chain-like protein [Amazona aestiva]|uniref:Collagen alpha-1(XXII) chain-like protein n=1 Tax=Amazona aestiva TaxID=12930 RepID=A0A0Q3LWI5_AMAAE|nr:collagen alpha-1(XXII) chain-like protein [Amazona aestiva]
MFSAAPTGCKNVHYDLVFLLDASSSVGKENFEKVRQWVSNLVETFEIGPDKTRVSVVRYSDRPTTEFDLGKYRTREEIKEAARNIKYYGGNTNTGDALRYINTYSFSREAGGRLSDRTVKKVAILLTDGRSQDHVLDSARAAHQAGIRIFVVGVGEALKEELDEIASEPKSAHVFHVSDYNAIDKIRGKLRRRLCESLNKKFLLSLKLSTEIEDGISVREACDRISHPFIFCLKEKKKKDPLFMDDMLGGDKVFDEHSDHDITQLSSAIGLLKDNLISRTMAPGSTAKIFFFSYSTFCFQIKCLNLSDLIFRLVPSSPP